MTIPSVPPSETAQPPSAAIPASRWRKLWEPTRSVLSTLLLTMAVMIAMAFFMARGPSADPAPPFSAKSVQGAVVELSSAPKRPVVLYFWATWCGACKLTSPTVSNYAARHPEVEVIGIAVDELPAVRAYLADTPRDFTTVVDDGTIARAYGIQAYPTTFAIGRHGRITWSRQGVLMPGELDLRAGQ